MLLNYLTKGVFLGVTNTFIDISQIKEVSLVG
nr:MAG TPA: hypothetical protein [Caudoviricetes sp.]DAN71903.1 MAG TPA: hypothetical protein [Caudoviricetes sp.]